MAEINRKKSKTMVPELERRNFWRGIIVFLIGIFIFSSLVWCGFVIYDRLFVTNNNFILRDVEIKSTVSTGSRWSQVSAKDDLCRVLGIKLNETNLFGMELPELRKRALENCPGIERIAIARVLPDKLKVDIVERMPQASLRFMGPDGRSIELKQNLERTAKGEPALGVLLADSQCVVMSRRDCAQVNPELLPQITFQAQYLVPGALIPVHTGETLSSLAGAMQLLTEAKLRPQFEIKSIVFHVRSEKLELTADRKYVVRFVYGNFIGTAILPAEKVTEKLDALESAVAQSIATGKTGVIYDLTFENQVIVK